MTFDQNLFVYYLLRRVVEIQKSINVTDPDNQVRSIAVALPRWWEPISNKFPGFYNRAKRVNSVGNGRPLRKHTYIVTMRLVVGPAFAGYQGQYEDIGNMFYAATLNAFDRQQRLAAPFDPPDNEPLQYVEHALIQQGDGGIEARVYNTDEVYMCIDYPLEVVANFQVYRQS